MFATIIKDAYRKGEEIEIAEALNELCCATDTYGWASSGIYCFWNYYTKEIYYIGLAVDLEERFKQHNGIITVNRNGCKKEKIDNYFKKYDKLGYSVFLQSPLSQPITSKNKKVWNKKYFENASEVNLCNEEDRDDLKIIEGILIEVYRKKHGKFPLWNQIGGAVKGQKNTIDGNYAIIESFSFDSFSPLIARKSLRDLAKRGNETKVRYEEELHAVRLYMLYFNMTFLDAFNYAKKIGKSRTLTSIEEEGYVYNTLNF